MKVLDLHPGVTAEQVQENTGFELSIGPDVGVTELPTDEELAALRHLDPDKVYIA
jgi:glutaconate CoA-transferase subunit B